MSFQYTTGAATNSKNPDRYAEGAPRTISMGQGAWVYGGRKLVDLTSGLGAVILGHGYEPVLGAAMFQLQKGVAYPLPSEWEESVAQQLTDFLPWNGAEVVRWSKNGRDATAAAVRLARAVTGRDLMLYCDYHGSDDMFLGPPMNAGVPEACFAATEDALSVKVTRGQILSGRLPERGAHLNYAACVVLEPVSSNAPEEPHDMEFFRALREQCDRHGVLMILDEMVSFGRAPHGSAQQWLDIQPDLWVGGKCLANGLPLTAVVGPRRYMERYAKDVFHSMTHAGEAVSLAAASETLKALRRENVAAEVNRFGGEIVELFAGHGRKVRFAYPSRLMFDFSREELGVLLKHGVLCAGYANFTLAHAQDEEAGRMIRQAFEAVLERP